jgi:acyl dehydratase
MSGTDQTVWFEDIDAGTTVNCGSTTVSKYEIVAFAEEFDPLAIHTDSEVAATTQFEGIIASGYHTLCLSVRLLVEEVRSKRAVVGGLGIDDVTWQQPVRPGDTLNVKTEILDTRPTESDLNKGVVHERVTVRNQHETTVLSYENYELISCWSSRD